MVHVRKFVAAPASLTVLLVALAAMVAPRAAAQPLYNIVNLGVAPGTTDTASSGMSVSPNGTYVSGFSSGTGINRGILWTQAGGTVALPNLAGRSFNSANGVNNAGTAAGTAATTAFGSNPLPVIWKNNTVAQLPLPTGQTLGRVNGINLAELAVGSVNGGTSERAATFTEAGSAVMTQTLPNGGVLRTAFGVNDAGRIVGQGTDPANAAVTAGWYIDPGDATATNIGALTALGHNSAIPFGVSSNGLITGSSSLNSGSGGRAFLWSESGGMTEIPLPAGTTTNSGRGVNAQGWVVGNSSAATSIPFLYDGTQSYRLHDLIPTGSGWDLITGTSNAAFSISDDGIITGRGLFNGALRGFVMIPVPEPTVGLMALALPALLRRRRSHQTTSC